MQNKCESCGLPRLPGCSGHMVETEFGFQCPEFVGHKEALAKKRLGDDPSDFVVPKAPPKS